MLLASPISFSFHFPILSFVFKKYLGLGLDIHTHPHNSLTPQGRLRSGKVGDTIIWPRPAGTLARLYIKWSSSLGIDPEQLVARLFYPYRPQHQTQHTHTPVHKSTACSRLFWKSHFLSNSNPNLIFHRFISSFHFQNLVRVGVGHTHTPTQLTHSTRKTQVR